jgi:hypothetical protein
MLSICMVYELVCYAPTTFYIVGVDELTGPWRGAEMCHLSSDAFFPYYRRIEEMNL